MEAMYFGTPVITYSAAGPIDVISNDKDGVVINNFNSDEWAKKLYFHMFEKNDCEKMGELGKQKINSEYLWPIVAEKYYDKYMEIIKSE